MWMNTVAFNRMEENPFNFHYLFIWSQCIYRSVRHRAHQNNYTVVQSQWIGFAHCGYVDCTPPCIACGFNELIKMHGCSALIVYFSFFECNTTINTYFVIAQNTITVSTNCICSPLLQIDWKPSVTVAWEFKSMALRGRCITIGIIAHPSTEYEISSIVGGPIRPRYVMGLLRWNELHSQGLTSIRRRSICA